MAIAVLNLTQKATAFVIEKIRQIIMMITGNGTYVSPFPALSDLTTKVNELDVAYQESIDGSKLQKQTARQKRREMMDMMRQLTGYVNSVTSDPTEIISAGFDVKSAGSPIGILPPPSDVRLDFGPVPGSLRLMYDRVPKRRAYKLQQSDDGITWNDLAPLAYTGKTRMIVNGLTPGQTYYFRVFTLSTVGLSGPSDAASHIVV